MEGLQQINELKTSPELMNRLKENSINKTYTAGDTILSENAYIRSIPIVISGTLKIIRTEEDSREILLYYLQPGESCVMSFSGGLHNDTSKVKAVVEEDAEILFLPIEKVSLFIKEYPQWLDYILRMYHKRFEELLDIVNAISFKRMDERLLNLLHKKQELTNSNILNITHEQLSNELGTSRVVISRLLKQLEELHKVKLGRNKIELL